MLEAQMEKHFYICTMIKDEHPYVREWALYHKSLGFTKMFLYDDKSSHPYDDELGDLIESGFIEIRQVNDNRRSRQVRVFNKFIHSRDWGEEDWCAFLDVDEFLSIDGGENIEKFLEPYKPYAGVMLIWKNYNANSRVETPKGISTMEAYTEEIQNPFIGPQMKPIAHLKYVNCFLRGPHYFNPVSGKIIVSTEEKEFGEATGYMYARSYKGAHIKHYITKSWEDWIRRLKRGNVTTGIRTVETFFNLNPDLNRRKDELIKDLDYDEFPTIKKDDSKWDGEAWSTQF